VSVSSAEMAALLDRVAGRATAPVRPEPEVLRCTVCGDILDAFHADLMTHPTCDPEPVAAPLPPSTVTDLRPILVDFEAGSPRSLQTAIGPSEIAVECQRRLAYTLAGTPTLPDGRIKWEAMLGTAGHAMLADALRFDNERLGRQRWLVEERVFPDPSISGSCDCYDLDNDVVIDWKIVGKTSLEHYSRRGPSLQYKGQIHIYGRGWQRKGLHPAFVRIVFLPRATKFDDAYEWTERYSRRYGDGQLDRMYATSGMLADLDVANHPDLWNAVPAAPGADCRFCPYYRRGAPADATGCPGDVDAEERRAARFREGLIAPSTKE